MQNTRSWMPVFVVLESVQEIVGVHSDVKSCPLPQAGQKTQDYSQRVGTAFLGKNGEIEVRLFALPLNGRFVLRAATPADRINPTSCFD